MSNAGPGEGDQPASITSGPPREQSAQKPLAAPQREVDRARRTKEISPEGEPNGTTVATLLTLASRLASEEGAAGPLPTAGEVGLRLWRKMTSAPCYCSGDMTKWTRDRWTNGA